MTQSELLEQAIAPSKELPVLEPGDRLDQKTFHARYEAMPKHVRAELIGGIVHMPSPAREQHGIVCGRLAFWLCFYQSATVGTQVIDNSTTILGDESEPQPDGCLLLLPEYGGQSRVNENEYRVGPPELVGEVSLSSESYDLHAKRLDYEKAGVKEYVVIVLRQKRIVWFVRRAEGFVEMQPAADGIHRSELFPGLWLDGQALIRGDTSRVRQVLEQGLASPEHARFVADLAGRVRK